MGVLSYQLSVLHNTTIAQLLLCTAEVQERAVPEPSLHLRLLLQPQWCVLTRIHFEQGLCCCCSTAGAGLPGFSSPPSLEEAGPVRVTSALLCSAKISAHPVWLLQGPAGLNLSSAIYVRISTTARALSILLILCVSLFLNNLW